jgi:hypothetical protein
MHRPSLVTGVVAAALAVAACSGPGESVTLDGVTVTGVEEPAAATSSEQTEPTTSSEQTEDSASSAPSEDSAAPEPPAAGVARLDPEACSGSFTGLLLDEDLTVRPGATCDLSEVWVDGDLVVEEGAVLLASGVTLTGNVEADEHREVRLQDSFVEGNVILEEGGTGTVVGVVVEGDIEAVDNAGPQRIEGNTVDGNLVCDGNATAPTGGGNIVAGDREDQCAGL